MSTEDRLFPNYGLTMSIEDFSQMELPNPAIVHSFIDAEGKSRFLLVLDFGPIRQIVTMNALQAAGIVGTLVHELNARGFCLCTLTGCDGCPGCDDEYGTGTDE